MKMTKKASQIRRRRFNQSSAAGVALASQGNMTLLEAPLKTSSGDAPQTPGHNPDCIENANYVFGQSSGYEGCSQLS
jgi:hypothetical protein